MIPFKFENVSEVLFCFVLFFDKCFLKFIFNRFLMV